MNEQKGVQISTGMQRAVLALMQATGDGRRLEQVVEAALKAWLAATAVAQPAAAAAAARGYQWKSLFLPEGSQLRIAVGGTYQVATVCGDRIMFEGRPYSPRQFVMHVTGQVRNAWLSLWIHCPGDARWHLADTRRRILRHTPARVLAMAPTPSSPSLPLPPSPTSPPSALPPDQVLLAHRRQSYLRRDDWVHDEQANLSLRLPCGRGMGPYGAGRAGPHDRRILGNLLPGTWARQSR